MTAPTCLQCLNTPRRRNTTLLATVLTALDRCRNGTTDSFSPVNISSQDAPTIIQDFLFPKAENSSANRTVKREVNGAARVVARATTWPCPTLLYNGAESGGSSMNGFEGLSFVLTVGLSLALGMLV